MMKIHHFKQQGRGSSRSRIDGLFLHLLLVVTLLFCQHQQQYHLGFIVGVSASSSSSSGSFGVSSNHRRFYRQQRSGSRRRNLFMFGNMDSWIQQQKQRRQNEEDYFNNNNNRILLASASSRDPVDYRPPPMEEEEDHEEDFHNHYDYDTHHNRNHRQQEKGTARTNGGVEEKLVENEYSSPPPPATGTGTGSELYQEKKKGKVKMWPPWPFNLLQQRQPGGGGAVSTTTDQIKQGPLARLGGFVFGLVGQGARVSSSSAQIIGSRLWFHLPPMTPPLLLLALLPKQETQIVTNIETGAETVLTKTVIPLLSNSLARTLVVTGFSLAIMSWAHAELNRIRKLTPLPLNAAYRDIHGAVLPHVLPDEVPEPFLVDDDDDEDEEEGQSAKQEEEVPQPSPSPNGSTTSKISQKLYASVPPRLQKHFNKFKSSEEEQEKRNKRKRQPKNWRRNMKRMREARRCEAQKVRRMAIYDELVALQAIKRKAAAAALAANAGGSKKKRSISIDKEEPLGYALVTGASRGIGRAIAVELARWEIPLILVARDLPRLTSLAYDLEACYGIKCCVLQADLSKPNAAERIHQATKDAGLNVDILINNAGISSTGLAVDMPLKDVDTMIRVNGVAVAHLAHLYGKDMKDKRRGRILMVSSVVGAVTAGPTVAMYAATKAFEKTLGLSIAKELEPYGVGVTCLMPGAVKDTDFRSSSSTHEALCWKLPGYPKKPSTVASMGIRALLTGNQEVTPGWQNRAFLKVFQPAMPQRLHNILVEIAWNPLMVPTFLKLWKTPENRQNERKRKLEDRYKHPVDIIERKSTSRRKPSEQEWRPRSNRNLPPPLLLTVPGEEEESTSPVPLKEPEPKQQTQPSLVGPDPIVHDPLDATIDSPSVNDTSVKTIAGTEDSAGMDEANEEVNSLYDELRKLGVDESSSAAAENTNSSSVLPPSPPSTKSETTTTETAPDMQQQQQHQNQQMERNMLQLKEQVLKLQEQMQKKERDQFLQEMELERQKRELEYEKRDMERERQRRRRQEEEDEERDHGREFRDRPSTRSSSGRSPQTWDSKEDDELIQSRPRYQRPKKGHEERMKRDLMAESLDHPLLSQ